MRRIAAACLALSLALLAGRAIAADVTASEPWASELARIDATDREAPPKPGGVEFLGSSSIRLWTTMAEDFPGVAVVNRGFGGSQIADSTRLAARLVTPYRPRLVVFYAGDNDIAAGRSPRQVRNDFAAFVARVRRDLPGLPIAFVSIKPSPSRARFLAPTRTANALIRDYAKTQRDIRYVDVFTPMLDGHGHARAELFGADGLHMNRAGYALWAERIAPALRAR